MQRKLFPRISCAFLLVFALLVQAPPAHASRKKDLQKQAKAAEANGDVEAAQSAYCELLDLEKKSESVKAKCDDYAQRVQELHKKDADAIAAGKSALADHRFDDATRSFKAVTSKQYHDEAARYLTTVIPQARQQAKADLEARERQKQAEQARNTERFNQGLSAYQNNEFEKAKSLLTGITGGDAAEALRLIGQIDSYTKAFHEASQFEKTGKYKQAVESYKQAFRIKPDGPGEVRQKLARAEAQRTLTAKAPAAGAVPQAPGEEPALSTEDEVLADAIAAYYKGDYQQAEARLAAYSGSGRRKALATFYLGASELSRYFLGGANQEQRDLYDRAISHFRAARQAAPDFIPPQPYVSPRILKVFNESALPGS